MSEIIKKKPANDVDNKFQQIIHIVRNLDITLSLFIKFMDKEKSFKKYFDSWVEEQKKKQDKDKEKEKEQNKGK